jgi:hypothetical protein
MISNLANLAQFLPYLGYTQNLGSYNKGGNKIAAAMTNMDSPLYQKMYGQFRQQGQQNMAEMIAEAQRQNRKAAAMGRNPLFSAERGGEVLFREMARNNQDTQNQAMMNTFNQLGNAYNATAQQGQLRQQAELQQAGVYGNVAGAIAKLFNW